MIKTNKIDILETQIKLAQHNNRNYAVLINGRSRILYVHEKKFMHFTPDLTSNQIYEAEMFNDYKRTLKKEYEQYHKTISDLLIYEEIKPNVRCPFVCKYFTYNLPLIKAHKGTTNSSIIRDVFDKLPISNMKFKHAEFKTKDDFIEMNKGLFVNIDFEHFYFQIQKHLGYISTDFYNAWSFYRAKDIRNVMINLLAKEPTKFYYDKDGNIIWRIVCNNHINRRKADNIRSFAHNTLIAIIKKLDSEIVISYNTDGIAILPEYKNKVLVLFAKTSFSCMTTYNYKVSQNSYYKDGVLVFL